jgi:hypothetical protein
VSAAKPLIPSDQRWIITERLSGRQTDPVHLHRVRNACRLLPCIVSDIFGSAPYCGATHRAQPVEASLGLQRGISSQLRSSVPRTSKLGRSKADGVWCLVAVPEPHEPSSRCGAISPVSENSDPWPQLSSKRLLRRSQLRSAYRPCRDRYRQG